MPRNERAPDAGRQWAGTIAANVRHHRRVRDLHQRDVADRMTLLGYPWTQRTVSDAERHNRDLTFDEVAALAIVLGVTPVDLLDPRGFQPSERPDLPFIGLGNVTVEQAAEWLAGTRTIALVQQDDGKLRLRNERGTT